MLPLQVFGANALLAYIVCNAIAPLLDMNLFADPAAASLRQAGFAALGTFLPATCCRVTRDELTLLSVLDEAECNLPARCARLAQTSLAPRIERSVREAHAVLARTRKLIGPTGSKLQTQHGIRLN